METFQWELANAIEEMAVDYGMDFHELVERALKLLEERKSMEGKNHEKTKKKG